MNESLIDAFAEKMVFIIPAVVPLEELHEISEMAIRKSEEETGLTHDRAFQTSLRPLLGKCNLDIEEILESLSETQMRKDLKDSLLLSLSTREPTATMASMLMFKGVVLPLLNKLKDSQTTIDNLLIATKGGNK